jgi:hypothetical protein
MSKTTTPAKAKALNTASLPTGGASATGAPAQNLAPATEPDASGALVEPAILEGVDTSHPAVDDQPREGLPASSNQIDFNDPHKPGSEVVAEALGYKSEEA